MILQQSVELLELLNGLVFQIRVGDLEADAVCGPRELTGEHLCQDPRHYRHDLNERKGDGIGGCRIALNTGEVNLKLDLFNNHSLHSINYHRRNIISQIKYPSHCNLRTTRHFEMTWLTEKVITQNIQHKDVAPLEQIKAHFTSQANAEIVQQSYTTLYS